MTPTPTPPGWQPIETAPRDGTEIIGGIFRADSTRFGDVTRCWWQPEFDAFISCCREMVMAAGYTFKDGTTRQLHSPAIEPVTHWRELPPPPPEPTP